MVSGFSEHGLELLDEFVCWGVNPIHGNCSKDPENFPPHKITRFFYYRTQNDKKNQKTLKMGQKMEKNESNYKKIVLNRKRTRHNPETQHAKIGQIVQSWVLLNLFRFRPPSESDR